MRRQNDFYPTPEFATDMLMRYVDIEGSILECCAGDGAISTKLDMRSCSSEIWTNDIDPERSCHYGFDAAVSWPSDLRRHDWVVTNPPFSHAAQIVPLAYSHAKRGIAMLLRLSYLEPVENRGAWLSRHPLTALIMLPRISFTRNGKTDNVTCAWMIWNKAASSQKIIVAENPRFTARSEPQRFGEWAGTGIMSNGEGPLP